MNCLQNDCKIAVIWSIYCNKLFSVTWCLAILLRNFLQQKLDKLLSRLFEEFSDGQWIKSFDAAPETAKNYSAITFEMANYWPFPLITANSINQSNGHKFLAVLKGHRKKWMDHQIQRQINQSAFVTSSDARLGGSSATLLSLTLL